MSTTNHETARSVLTMACPDCGTDFEVDFAGNVETVEYNPEGVIEVTCDRCGEDFAIGFQRTGG